MTSNSGDNTSPPKELASSLNPCTNVRRSCHYIMQEPLFQNGGTRSVEISSNQLVHLAKSIHSLQKKKLGEWDSQQWHYSSPNKQHMALYILALDAINFCFWPKENSQENNKLEYEHLAMAMTKVAHESLQEKNHFFFSAQHLANMTTEEFTTTLQPHLVVNHQQVTIPNIKERVRLWNQVGHGLLEHFHGSPLELIEKAHKDAPTLVHLLVSNFAGFRDESLYKSRQVFFYKRAQILVGDWNACLELKLNNMHQLTMFADYRVPQVLRHLGVLQYNPALSHKVDSQIEIQAHSHDELYIRAATICAVEQLVKEVQELSKEEKNENNTNPHHVAVTDVTLDWYLWQLGEELHQEGRMKPHHKTQTIFY